MKYSILYVVFLSIILLSACKCKSKQSIITDPRSVVTELINNSVTDIDGNVYPIIQIGDQFWMGENLRASRYNNGEIITKGTGMSSLGTRDEEGLYTWYNNDENNDTKFGKLYNYHAVMEGNLCPKGWHVPSSDEWDILISNTGGIDLSGGLLKTQGTIEYKNGLWQNPNKGATNETGFGAMPGGIMNPNDLQSYYDLGKAGYWWTTSPVGRRITAYKSISYESEGIESGGMNENNFLSVRCIKDESE